MRRAFVDTAGWMMLVDAADRRHEDARRWRDDHLAAGGSLVTSDYVVDETLTLLRMRLGLRVAGRWWGMVAGSRRVEVTRIDQGRAERARAWFFSWSDQRFSFTDCTSFVLMEELGLGAALTSDRHFLTAGFRIGP